MPEPRFIDAHGHPQFPAYDDGDAVVTAALSEGVWSVAVGTTLSTSRAGARMASRHEGVYAAVGIHPTHASRSHADPSELGGLASSGSADPEVFDAAAFEELLRDPKVVAVGECGLDYFRMDAESKKAQESLFRAQLSFARVADKPVMLHVRGQRGDDRAYEDALSILEDYPGLSADFHFYAGSAVMAERIIGRGYLVSFTGVLTFTHDYDELVRSVPLDRILAETDCPYVAPVPFRGKRNEPLFVREVYAAIARIKGEDGEGVREALTGNARRFFRI